MSGSFARPEVMLAGDPFLLRYVSASFCYAHLSSTKI